MSPCSLTYMDKLKQSSNIMGQLKQNNALNNSLAKYQLLRKSIGTLITESSYKDGGAVACKIFIRNLFVL